MLCALNLYSDLEKKEKDACYTSHFYYCVFLLYILSLLKESFFPRNFNLSTAIFDVCDLWLSHWTFIFIRTNGLYVSLRDFFRIELINVFESTSESGILKR